MQDREFGSRARVRVKVYDFNIDLGRRESARGPDSRANLDHSDLPGCAPDSLAASMHTYTPTSLVPPLSLRLTKTVMAPSLTDDRRAIFAEPFESALPYRVIETEQVFDWDSAMIDDERIIGLRVSHPSIIEQGLLYCVIFGAFSLLPSFPFFTLLY